MTEGGEVIHAKRNLPKALFLGILIVVIINFLITVVVVGVAGPETLKGTKSLIHVAELFMPGPAIMFFAIAGALVASCFPNGTRIYLQSRHSRFHPG